MEKIKFEVDEDMPELTINVPEYDTLTFNCGDDKEIILTYADGKLELSGDGDMNKAAKDFFEHFLKPIVDDYVTKELSKKGQ